MLDGVDVGQKEQEPAPSLPASNASEMCLSITASTPSGARVVYVRRAYRNGRLKCTKTEGSVRAVPLQAVALEALDRLYRPGEGRLAGRLLSVGDEHDHSSRCAAFPELMGGLDDGVVERCAVVLVDADRLERRGDVVGRG